MRNKQSKIPLKIALYLRKSTEEEDRQALSIEKQRKKCFEILQELQEDGEEIEVIETIEESISGFKENKREGFRKLTKLINGGKINAIICWKVSRLARNPLDQAIIENALIKREIEYIFSSERTFTSDEPVRLLRDYFSDSTQYSLNLSKDVKEGMLTKVLEGQPVKIARGYEFDKNKNVHKNSEAVAIREIFRLRRGGVSMKEIGIIVSKKFGFQTKTGNPLPSSSINEILKNPIYYGAIRYLGEFYEGKFDPVVTKEEWEKANSMNTSDRRSKKVDELDFVRGLLKNAETGNFLSPYLQKGNIYFSSTERGQGKTINYSLNKLLDYFDKHIHEYELPEELKPYYIEAIRTFYLGENDRVNEEEQNAQKELKRIENKLSNILEMRINGELSSEEYLEMKEKFLQKKNELLLTIDKLCRINTDILEKAEKCFELAVNLSQTYKQGNILQKTEIIKMVCFELFVDHQKCLHIEERELYKGIKNMGNTVWLG